MAELYVLFQVLYTLFHHALLFFAEIFQWIDDSMGSVDLFRALVFINENAVFGVNIGFAYRELDWNGEIVQSDGRGYFFAPFYTG